jgi:hypothetical protein
MEGVKVETKSKNEIIGERLSALIPIEDAVHREAEARRILEELNVPAENRDIWLEPFIDA